MEKSTIFQNLYNINISEKIEKKDGLNYISWANAWTELMKVYPDATYSVNKIDNKPYLYDENLGYMVETSITINGMTKSMMLPVMDSKNKAMKAQAYTYKTKFGDKTVAPATMFDINTAIMRCLVKNIAVFGLGLYIYVGDDLPETEKIEQIEKNDKAILSERRTKHYEGIKNKDYSTLTAEQKSEFVKRLTALKGIYVSDNDMLNLINEKINLLI